MNCIQPITVSFTKGSTQIVVMTRVASSTIADKRGRDISINFGN
jgi:hypothetical protein